MPDNRKRTWESIARKVGDLVVKVEDADTNVQQCRPVIHRWEDNFNRLVVTIYNLNKYLKRTFTSDLVITRGYRKSRGKKHRGHRVEWDPALDCGCDLTKKCVCKIPSDDWCYTCKRAMVNPRKP